MMLSRTPIQTEEPLLTMLDVLGPAPQSEAELLAVPKQLRDECSVASAAGLVSATAIKARAIAMAA